MTSFQLAKPYLPKSLGSTCTGVSRKPASDRDLPSPTVLLHPLARTTVFVPVTHDECPLEPGAPAAAPSATGAPRSWSCTAVVADCTPYRRRRHQSWMTSWTLVQTGTRTTTAAETRKATPSGRTRCHGRAGQRCGSRAVSMAPGPRLQRRPQEKGGGEGSDNNPPAPQRQRLAKSSINRVVACVPDEQRERKCRSASDLPALSVC